MTLWMTCDQSLSGNLELLWTISEGALHTHKQNTNKAKSKQQKKLCAWAIILFLVYLLLQIIDSN